MGYYFLDTQYKDRIQTIWVKKNYLNYMFVNTSINTKIRGRSPDLVPYQQRWNPDPKVNLILPVLLDVYFFNVNLFSKVWYWTLRPFQPDPEIKIQRNPDLKKNQCKSGCRTESPLKLRLNLDLILKIRIKS